MFYLTTHSTHFINGYMASDIWLRTIQIVREETRCRHMGYSYRLTARVLLYAPSNRQDNTYHGLYYTSRGALAGTRNSSGSGVNESLLWGANGGRAWGVQTFVTGGGGARGRHRNDFSPTTFIVHNQKSNGGGGGWVAMEAQDVKGGGHSPQAPPP